MKFIHADNLVEWLAFKTNLVPMPLVDGFCFCALNKAFNTALKLDVFEAAKDGPRTVEQIAGKTGLHPGALPGLLNVLTVSGYFKYKNGKYALTRTARKWCLKDSPDGMYRSARYYELICDWMDYLEEYLKTGKGISIHDSMTREEWYNYQIGMEDFSKIIAKSAPRMTPMPGNPTEMLDIGGSHGLYCVELCKKYRSLKAIILDLPDAVAEAERLLERHNMGDRIVYRAGNAITDDLGENQYDLVMMSSVMHNLSAEDNIEVSRKVNRALKTGGYFVVQEFIRPAKPSSKHAVSIMTNIIFNITSTSNTWSINDIKEFQQRAGLTHYKVNKYIQMPGFTQVCAKKE